MTIAFTFPGQGSQAVGMGKGLSDAYPAARAVFAEVDDALSENLSKLVFEGPQAELTLTQNAQPALMAVSLAAFRVLSERVEGLSHKIAFAAGHSLGEYSALAAAGCLGVGETAKLLRLRGLAMQAAVPVGQGAMAALIGATVEQAEKLAAAAAGPDVCQVANDNDPGQVVLSGSKAAIDRAIALAKEHGVRRAVLLDVSAPFHSALMQPAASAMQEALAHAKIQKPVMPIVANVHAHAITDPEILRRGLVTQVTGRVRWRETVAFMAANGVDVIYEVGAGKVLSGLAKRIVATLEAKSVGTPDDVEAAVPVLNAAGPAAKGN